jgi:hypothetical protein
MDFSEILGITWNEQFIQGNNENRFRVYSLKFFRNKIAMATLLVDYKSEFQNAVGSSTT